jgi:hypothetical protein
VDGPAPEAQRSSTSGLLPAIWLGLQAIWVGAVVLGVAQLRGMVAELPMLLWLWLSALAVILTSVAWWLEPA